MRMHIETISMHILIQIMYIVLLIEFSINSNIVIYEYKKTDYKTIVMKNFK